MEIEISRHWTYLWNKRKRWDYTRYYSGKFELEKLVNGVSSKFIEYVFVDTHFTYRGWLRVLPIFVRTKLSIKWISGNVGSGITLLEIVMNYGDKNRLDEYVGTIGLPESSDVLEIMSKWKKYKDMMEMKKFMMSVEYLIRKYNFTISFEEIN